MSNKSTAGGRKIEKSIGFERVWVEEAKRAAHATNHQPVVQFGFDPDSQDQREDWAAVPLSAFAAINRVLASVAAGDLVEAQEALALVRRSA
jgi:hypothetical protein